jgi:hypothetical protein
MALSLAEVYHLTSDTLRRECEVRGLDHSGPVRLLRQRLADHIRSGPMDIAAKAEGTQASDQNDLVCDESIIDPPVGPIVSRGSSGDSPIPVLVELLRPLPHLTSEDPEAIMRLFIRLDEVHGLGLVADRIFILESCRCLRAVY